MGHLNKLIDSFINDFILKSINHKEYRSKFLPLFAVICQHRPDLNGNLHILDHSFFDLMASTKNEEDQIKAMQILRSYLKPQNEETLKLNDRSIVILLPMIRCYVYIDGDLGDKLRVSAMNVIGNMAECSCWTVYRRILDKFMSDYQNEQNKKKLNYKIIALECIMRITKRFHFEVDCVHNLVR